MCQYRHKLTPVVHEESTETAEEKISFITSTPKKQKLSCENCYDKSQCDTCFVDQYIQKTKGGDRKHFREELQAI